MTRAAERSLTAAARRIDILADSAAAELSPTHATVAAYRAEARALRSRVALSGLLRAAS